MKLCKSLLWRPTLRSSRKAIQMSITMALGPISLAWLSACATLYEKELRLKKWRLAHNYPVCSQCGDVTSRLHGANLICPLCFATEYVGNAPRWLYLMAVLVLILVLCGRFKMKNLTP
jgi:hypothetical protein